LVNICNKYHLKPSFSKLVSIYPFSDCLLVFLPLYFSLVYLYRLSRILLVEDEMDLMQLYRDVLSGAGHEVDGFTGSVDAYSRFQENPDRYDAVISDVRMQGMSGIQLAKKLKEIRNDVQVFLISAFEIAEDHHSDLKEIELKGFLQKPFHMQQLVAMVEKHIGQQAITNSPQIRSGII
jgi:DNA-binding NtrC family response regulator